MNLDRGDRTGDVLAPVMALLLKAPSGDWAERLNTALERHGWEFFTKVLWENRITLRAARQVRDSIAEVWRERLDALVVEHEARVAKNREFLRLIQERLDLEMVFIKSLDNWPDFGHDVDVLTRVGGGPVRRALAAQGFRELEQTVAERLADKINFAYGDHIHVEVHSGRLGEVGEHRAIAEHIMNHRQNQPMDGLTLPGPDPDARVMLVVLQRMYRHFNVRACDAINVIAAIGEGRVDVQRLYATCRKFGIHDGARWFVRFMNEIHEFYRGRPLLPGEPSGNELYFANKLIRFDRRKFVPLMFGRKLNWDLWHGQWSALGRELLVPPMLVWALVQLKLFKKEGVW